MNFFDSITEKLTHTFSKITNRGKLTELEINNAMREIRVALLEADVNFSVVKQFINKVKKKALGEEILKSLTPGQQVVKVVNEELVQLMGGKTSPLKLDSKPPTSIMVCGLQGAGKTTFSAKLALKLKKEKKKVLLVANDIYRPAAIEQLKTLAKSVDVELFEKGKQKPEKTAKEANKYAKNNDFDVVIYDTAGRNHIDKDLMQELTRIKSAVGPMEILLTVDAMTGQDAVNVAKEFDEKFEITGVVLTKLDSDTRGGAALSIRAVTGKPIKFNGIGEKLDDLEVFHPDRMASRILGKGDVLSLIEKAESNIKQEDLKKTEKAFKENTFDLEDYLSQFENISKMGNIKDLLGMVPGMGKYKNMINNFDENKMIKQKAIIQSMTKRERQNPNIIKGSRKKRIANGSASTVQDVNVLLKQFSQMKEMMKKMKKGKLGMPKMPF